MSARAAVLARVRSAIASAPAPRPPDVPRTYRRQTQDDLETFLERLRHLDAHVARVDAGVLDQRVAFALGEAGMRRVVVPEGIPEDWVEGVEALRDDPPLDPHVLDGVDGVLTTCAVAIAQTGTIVLDGSPGMGRRVLSLIPDRHLCVVRAEQIVSCVPEAVAALTPTRPLTFITGPSATVDIEMVRVSGVHGPRHLHVLVAT